MTEDRTDTPWRSRDELVILHAVRLAGFAATEGVADRVDSQASSVGSAGSAGGTLRALEGQGLVEHLMFGDSAGWILTEAGRSRIAGLLRQELEASGTGHILRSTTENFESGVNPRLVRMITDWQLRSAAGQRKSSATVLSELTDLGDALHALMAGLVARLPRFARYPQQFSAALDQAHAGDLDWVAGVGRLSCHTVWAELHQDLLSSLGRGRSDGPHQGQP